MPTKAAKKRTAHPSSCPPSTEDTEPTCAEGVCPMSDAACCAADAPPAHDQAGQLGEAESPTGDDAPATIENETDIPIEPKPKKARKLKPKDKGNKEEKGAKKAAKPPNAYMLFYQGELKKEEYNGIALPERAKLIGALWRGMGDAERAPFQERCEAAKAAAAAAEGE